MFMTPDKNQVIREEILFPLRSWMYDSDVLAYQKKLVNEISAVAAFCLCYVKHGFLAGRSVMDMRSEM
jgi:hypothetical protein